MKKSLIILMILLVFLVGCKEDPNDQVKENDNVVENIEESVDTPVYGDFKGYMWEVKNGDARVYLFGSIHISDENTYPFHKSVETAYESSDVLSVEADVTDTSAVFEVANLLRYPPGETVYDHLSEEGIVAFNIALEETSLTPQMIEPFKIWVAGSNIMQMQILSEGFSASEGIDMHFLNRAKKDNKSIDELEGIKAQVELINGFSDEDQEAMFITSLGTKEETIKDFEELFDAFMGGDDEILSSYLFSSEDDTMSSEIEEAMLKTRNIGMADKIEKYLKSDQTYFVVVGVAHYLGDDSVIHYLEEKGFTVERK